MKNLALSFRAQRLDNQDPDHMEIDQHLLAEKEGTKRQELANSISEVSLKGKEIFSEKGFHTAFLLGDKFLLETPSDQLDDAGRIATIITYGRVPDEPPESWSCDVVESLTAFAGRIGRTVSKKKMKVARRAIEAIIKKKQRNTLRRRALWATVFAISLVVICIIYWIVFKKD